MFPARKNIHTATRGCTLVRYILEARDPENESFFGPKHGHKPHTPEQYQNTTGNDRHARSWMCVLVFQARAARKLELQRKMMPNQVLDAAATVVRGAQGVKGVVVKGGAEVGGAIARGGGVIARGGVDVLTAGPTMAAGLLNAHAEVGTTYICALIARCADT